MNEIRNLIIGIDFSEKKTQLAYYDRKAGEAKSVEEKAGSGEFEIEPVLCLRTDSPGTCIGTEAVYFSREKGGILVDHLYQLSANTEPVTVGSNKIMPARLLADYFAGLLKLLGVSDVIRNTRCLVITVPELTPERVQVLSQACLEMGLMRDEFLLMDNGQSFYYYAMTSRRENWNRNIGWYDFDGKDIRFRRLRVASENAPVLIRLEKKGSCSLPDDEGEKDDCFAHFIKETLSEDLYSTVFLTGNSFSRSWAERSVRILCQNQRKVYYGNNLFVKGACQGGKEWMEDHNLKGYRFLSDSMILISVSMELRVMGAPSGYTLIEAGKNWYEYHPSCDLILDGEKELVFFLSAPGEAEKKRIVMKLPGLPIRPARTTRLHLELEFETRQLLVIRVRDMGFGEMFPSSGSSWTEKLDVKNWQINKEQQE